MSILFDSRLNEFQGNLDQIGGGVVIDNRVSSATLSLVDSFLGLDLNGHATVQFDLRQGSSVNAVVSIKGSVDGSNFFIIPFYDPSIKSYALSTIVSPDKRILANVASYRRVICNLDSITSGSILVTGRASQASVLVNNIPIATTQITSATNAVNTAVTVTLPAAGIGTHHFITFVKLAKLYNVVGVAAGAGVIVNTTNLGLTYTTEQLASAAGTVVNVINEDYSSSPLRSVTANVATSFTAPAQLQTIWRFNVGNYVF